jgi:hypothetical protein
MITLEHVNKVRDEVSRCQDPDGREVGTSMRTTVNIPPDALELARQRARERDLTLGEAIAELVRKGAEGDHKPSDFWKGVKFLPKRPGQPKVTSEQVYELLEETY